MQTELHMQSLQDVHADVEFVRKFCFTPAITLMSKKLHDH